MARPKLPEKKVQGIRLDLIPPNRTLVRREVRRAVKAANIAPASDATLHVVWVESDMQHSHAQISECVAAIFETLAEMRIIPKCANLNSRQRLNARDPRIEIMVEGRI